MSNTDKLQEAVSKLTAAISAVDAANELMARVKEEVKDMDFNPSALIFAIKRVQKEKLILNLLSFKMTSIILFGKTN